MEDVKVLSWWSSPFALRVHAALDLKGVKYEVIEEDVRNKSQLLLDSNPVYKKLPVLLHNGKPICESHIILQYIDEAWPQAPPLFPRDDPYARAQTKLWGDFIDSRLVMSCSQMFSSAKAVPRANKEFAAACDILEQQLLSKPEHTPFVGGETINYVDVMLSPFAAWFPLLVADFGLELPAAEKCPNLHRLLAALQDQPVLKASLPHIDKMRAVVRDLCPDRSKN